MNKKLGEEEVFEKVPDFINYDLSQSENIAAEIEFEGKYKNKRFSYLDAEELEELKKILAKPSQVKVDQAFSPVNFENYRLEIPPSFKEFSALYQNFNHWSEEAAFNVLEFYEDYDLTTLISKISYLPNNKYLSNLIELLALETINGQIDFGSISDTEVIFQSFKRIYDQRIQIVLISFLFYTYNLDKKLLPIKKLAYQVLNKSGKIFESAILLNDIQKTIIRQKKAQELLMQEGYNLQEKIGENFKLLLLLSDKNFIIYPIHKTYLECVEETITDDNEIIKKLAKNFEFDPNIVAKPVSQLLLTYKIGELGQKISNKLASIVGRNSDPYFKSNLENLLEQELKEVAFNYKNSLSIRDIVFSITDLSRKKNWNIVDIIKDIFTIFLSIIDTNNLNTLKFISYVFACECIFGVLKIKYRIDEIVQGLAKTLAYLQINIEEENLTEVKYKIIMEFIYNGMCDGILELYPNMITLDKNTELFINTLKIETENFKNITIERI